jgi:hypothetical protein
LVIAWPALTAGFLALALYARTLAPGLTWAHSGADGGDLLAAALTGGVPHPTGYPVYQLLLVAALTLFPGEPAAIGNALSAACAAGAVALLADLTRRTLAGRPWRHLVALAAGLTWATAPGLWSQAVITEVYALNALFVAALLWLMWRWRAAAASGARAWPWLTAIGLVFGLGLGNHLTLALMLPAVVIWLWLAQGQKAGRGAGRSWRWPLAAFALGLSTYAYLPWASAQQAPINWGDASTVSGFRWVVSGEIYRGLVLGVPLAHLPGRLAAWGAEANQQLGGGPWGALLALLGIWRLERADRRGWWATLAVAALFSVYAIGYNAADSYVYLIPAWAVASLWLAHGIAWLAEQVAARISRRWALIGVLALSLGLPIIAAARHWAEMDLSREHTASVFVAQVLAEAAPDAVILVGGDQPTFALWYARYGLRQRPDLIPVNVHLYGFEWYQSALARHHPPLTALMREGRLPLFDEFVAGAAKRWPLYRAGSLDRVTDGWVEEPGRTLVRLRPP